MHCLDCDRDFMPTKHEPCPECGTEETRITKTRAKCGSCGHGWTPAGLNECRWCHSENIEPNPKHDAYLDNVALPRCLNEEKVFEDNLKVMVHDHPVWGWAEQIKGLGETTLARLMAKTDITVCTTASKFFAHCGYGLNSDGSIQRKVKGETLTYNAKLQGNCVMTGLCLLRAKDSYYAQYLRFKGDCPEDFTDGHRHNRAMRHMIKLFQAHLWEVWREAEGLDAPRPYAFSILKHADEHYIDPWSMVKLAKEKKSR